MSYWVEFTSPVLVEGHSVMAACVHQDQKSYDLAKFFHPGIEDWKARNQFLEDRIAHFAGIFAPVKAVHTLPYGAFPSLDAPRPGDFCSDPHRCKGRSSCPKDYACSE